MTIRRRLVLLSACAVALAIAIASVAVYVLVRANLRGQVDTALRADAPKAFFVRVDKRTARVPADVAARARKQALAVTGDRALSKLPDENDVGVQVALPPERFGAATGIAQVVTRSGGVVGPAGDITSKIPLDRSAAAVVDGRKDAVFNDQQVSGVHLRILSVRLAGGEVLQLVRPLTDVDRTLRDLLWVLGAVTAGGIALAAGLGLFVARGTLRPVRRLTDTAEHVAATQDLSRRLPEGGRDEIDRLAASFNTMLAALEASREAQRQLVADASHELRTPLTSVRTNLELLARAPDLPDAERERIVVSVGDQVEELSVLVGDLVDLAKPNGHGAGEDLEEVRLDLLVSDAVTGARAHAADHEFVVDAAPCVVRGSRPRLYRAVRNLLDNAVKWSPPSAPIEVAVRDGEVVVRDHGPGIPDEDLPHIFDRFYRASSARGLPGSGLGLAIVRQVAEAHGGSISAESLSDGGARLRFQLSPTS
ncbi:MAG TPA: HAMP domain-containing sensor histidine kinase [Thermoleophilaceae bacterium]|nr:HAMP domain-containing sensor histidine kinase [Thermoleophilaceae bacterium]